MEVVRFNLAGDYKDLDQNIIDAAVSVIRRGGIIVFPTETVYGMGADAMREYSVRRMYKIKQRSDTKPFQVIVRDIDMAKGLAYISPKQEAALKQIWPGPTTVVLKKRSVLPDAVTAGQGTVGLRLPHHPVTSVLMHYLPGPLAATSVNISGKPAMCSSAEIISLFAKTYPKPDLILDAGDLPESLASSVIDLTGDEPKMLRVGPVSRKDLMEIFK